MRKIFNEGDLTKFIDRYILYQIIECFKSCLLYNTLKNEVKLNF
jgi:hypothetical protein